GDPGRWSGPPHRGPLGLRAPAPALRGCLAAARAGGIGKADRGAPRTHPRRARRVGGDRAPARGGVVVRPASRGRLIAPRMHASVTGLTVLVFALVALWGLLSLIAGIFNVSMFSMLLVRLY